MPVVPASGRRDLAWLAGSIRAAGLPCRFVTNTTRRPLRRIVGDLSRLGLSVWPEEIYTPAALARSFLLQRGLMPFVVTHSDLREEFADTSAGSGEAVVIGDAGEFFTYDLLNRAYCKIIGGAVFLALAKNRGRSRSKTRPTNTGELDREELRAHPSPKSYQLWSSSPRLYQ